MNASRALPAATEQAPPVVSAADAARDAVHAGRAAAVAAARQTVTQAEHALGEMLRTLAAQHPPEAAPRAAPMQPSRTDELPPLHSTSTSTSGDTSMSDDTQPTPTSPNQTPATTAQSSGSSQIEAALKAAQAQIDQAMAASDMAVQAAMQAATAATAAAGNNQAIDSANQALQQADQAAAAAVAAAQQQAEQAMSAGTPDSLSPNGSPQSTPDRS
ncbi:hypothetical protein [Xanthomonas cannabis]|uniref:hypothetical protein n=1 Tax=Xanthomonas cannabis TaxID=1885674 RepID=UPI0005736804|nr:hypothetical protein [Xanthomonas cannabis]KHL52499.1 hypothetical protein OZ10_17405 [Xanthomonas cannabis pv. cannabis]